MQLILNLPEESDGFSGSAKRNDIYFKQINIYLKKLYFYTLRKWKYKVFRQIIRKTKI